MRLEAHQYEELVRRVDNAIRNHEHLDAGDIINDVILELMESGKDLSFGDLKEMVISRAIGVARNKIGSINGLKFSRSETTRLCTTCKEVIPIGGFYLIHRKYKSTAANPINNTVEEISYNCKECQNKKSKQRQEKMKSDPIKLAKERERRRLYMQKYYKDPSKKRKKLEIARDYNKRVFNVKRKEESVRRKNSRP